MGTIVITDTYVHFDGVVDSATGAYVGNMGWYFACQYGPDANMWAGTWSSTPPLSVGTFYPITGTVSIYTR